MLRRWNARRLACALSWLVVTAGCGGSPPAGDAGTDLGPHDGGSCRTAVDCDDGLYCNGTEACMDGMCVSGPLPHCSDGIACTIDTCSEDLHRCVSRAPDVDHDGAGDATCTDAHGTPLGNDCDDNDSNRYPGNHEVCDAMHHDEDCDPTTHGGTDFDADTFESNACCNGTMCGTDCNDGVRSVHPGAPEVCNHVDDDCDAQIDEGVSIMVYVDADHDGDGDIHATATAACTADASVSVYNTDCHDDDVLDSGRFSEVCDNHDNDCDGLIDENAGNVTWYRDADGDGFGSPASGTLSSCTPPPGYSLLGTDCDDTTNTRSPARAEICDAIDDDCNGAADFAIAPGNFEDDDHDHFADSMCGMPFGMDCDDLDPNTHTGDAEICDGRDNDCDGHVDEDVTSMAFFGDHDGDGFGSEASGTMIGCEPVSGFTHQGGDCDDTSAMRYPGSVEGCNAIDDDCDGAIDEGEASLSCTLPGTLEACIVGTCAFVACADGFGDCTLTIAGCETNLATDMSHCGSCSTMCFAPQTCSSGSCTGGAPP
jgi:hypothetical protein